jgi:pilus assembly protein CpaF
VKGGKNMDLTLDLRKYWGIPYKKPKRNTLNLDQFLYFKRFGLEQGSNTLKKVNKELIDDIRDYLINEHDKILRESFGNPTKKKKLEEIISQYISQESPKIPKGFSLEELSREIVNEIAGLGVFDTILSQPNHDITDIGFNGTDIWIKDNKKGRYKSHLRTTSDEVEKIAKKIAYATGRTWNYSKPELDAELPNLRINAMSERVSPYGTTIAIRVFSDKLRINDEIFVEKMGSQLMLDFLSAIIKAKANILISGETGAGKTELLKFLIGKTKDNEKIAMLEDTLETNLKKLYPNKDIINWRTQESESEEMEITFSRLNRSALRNDVDWIIITETRGKEAYDMVKAVMTGHKMMTTLHAPSAFEAPERLIMMCQEGVNLDHRVLGKMITNNFDIGIHVELDLEDMNRRVVEIVEYIDYKDSQVIANTLFSYETVGMTLIPNEDNQKIYKPVREHKSIGKISEKLAKTLLQKQALTESILPIVPEEFLDKINSNIAVGV